MKKYFISTLLVLFAVCSVKAQQDTIKIHVDGTASLESLMEGVWEQGGECLRLTGTPTEEDISYLKGKFANGRFNIYDLRHFELKRIPDRFFQYSNYVTIILPECLEYIGKKVFNAYWLTIILTGHFPEIEEETFEVDDDYIDYCKINELRVSKDNPYLKEDKPYFETYDNGPLCSIYSKDGTYFYFHPMSFFKRELFEYNEFPNYSNDVEILEGTKYIAGAKFREVRTINIILPSTIESIGDCAFIRTDFETLYCNAINPPSLGKNIFKYDWLWDLYVPEGAEEDYLNHRDWSDVEIFYLNGKKIITVSNRSAIDKKILEIARTKDTYLIRSRDTMSEIIIYDLRGNLILQERIDNNRYFLKKSNLPKSPLLLRVELENGECETIKIIP